MDTPPPPTQPTPFNRLAWLRFRRAINSFSHSEVGLKGKLLFVGLIAFLLMISSLNVVNSYVGRDFMTAIAERNSGDFVREALLYVTVFALSTVVAGVYRFSEERLGLLWREWMTRQLVAAYLRHPTFYRLNDRLLANGEIANPDQRIAEDVRTFTTSTLSFVLLLLNGILTALAFSGVMWTISPLLFGIAVAYAFAGSYATIRLGMSLVGLNYAQLDKEASFRAELVHVGEHSESVALLQHESRLQHRLRQRLYDLTGNFRRIIGINFRVGLFSNGYNYLIQIIPALIVAPLYFRGEVEFGVITQSAMAFSQLLGAFSLIITQFQSLSSFTAVMARLGSLDEALEQARAVGLSTMIVCPHRRDETCPQCRKRDTLGPDAATIWVCQEDDRIAYERLTLRAPRDNRELIRSLSITITHGTRVRILGDVTAKVALFRVTAGIWDVGSGGIIRPKLGRIMFLPERPYLPPGTLRELLVPERLGLRDEDIQEVLRALHLESALAHAGGLDAELDWNDILSLSEQQLLGVARLLLAAPRFAFIDRPHSALSSDQVGEVLQLLSQHAITYVTLDEETGHGERYDAVLQLASDGSWSWQPTGDLRATG